MSTDYQLAVAIQQLAGTYQKDNLNAILCEVVSVDTSKRTCVVATVNADVEIKDVQLMAGVNDGMLLIPKVGSQVVIIYSKMTLPYISLYSELEKVICIVGDSGVEIAADSIQFNDGSFGGLVKIEQLVDKINALENLVNTILNTLQSTVIPLAPSGTYPFAPLYASVSPIAPITNKSDLENTNVTHGSSL